MRAFLSYTLDRAPKSLAFLDEVRAGDRERARAAAAAAV
jgi:hypothetical protein